MMSKRGLMCASMLVAGLSTACTPSLNWRYVTPASSGLTLMFPCSPDSQSRRVRLQSGDLELVMAHCSAAGNLYALSYANVDKSVDIGAMSAELAEAAVRNLSGHDLQPLHLKIQGLAARDPLRAWAMAGRLPDGAPVSEHIAIFVHGGIVYQAAVLERGTDRQGSSAFFEGLRFNG